MYTDSPQTCNDVFPFTVTIGADPCTTTTFAAHTLSTQTVYLDDGVHFYDVGRFQDTVSLSTGNNDGYTTCGNRDFSFTHTPSIGGTLVTALDQDTFSI